MNNASVITILGVEIKRLTIQLNMAISIKRAVCSIENSRSFFWSASEETVFQSISSPACIHLNKEEQASLLPTLDDLIASCHNEINTIKRCIQYINFVTDLDTKNGGKLGDVCNKCYYKALAEQRIESDGREMA